MTLRKHTRRFRREAAAFGRLFFYQPKQILLGLAFLMEV